MKKIKIKIIFIILSIGSLANANCLQELRKVNLLKVVTEAPYALGAKSKELREKRSSSFLQSVNSFGKV